MGKGGRLPKLLVIAVVITAMPCHCCQHNWQNHQDHLWANFYASGICQMCDKSLQEEFPIEFSLKSFHLQWMPFKIYEQLFSCRKHLSSSNWWSWWCLHDKHPHDNNHQHHECQWSPEYPGGCMQCVLTCWGGHPMLPSWWSTPPVPKYFEVLDVSVRMVGVQCGCHKNMPSNHGPSSLAESQHWGRAKVAMCLMWKQIED